MKNWVLTTTAVVAVSVTAAVGANSAKAMSKPSKGDTMTMTYSGCVQSVNHGAAFLLTDVDSGSSESMHGDMTMKQHDDMAMKHDDMAMKTGAPTTMPHEQTPMADKANAMPLKSFALAGSVNLKKHVGQKVSVTGSLSEGSMEMMRESVSTLTVKSLKVIAKSCS